ncbi:MAG TPA: hypothetical protein VK524_26530 [Polyangiaceae bacterium]|nr:hypothetical protein [Polyangiaceae bacterium]
MKPALRLFISLGAGACAAGCLVGRTITNIEAHDTHNSFKVQSAARYSTLLSWWDEWELSNCHLDGEVYRCREITYDECKAGFQRPEQPLPVSAPSQQPPPAQANDRWSPPPPSIAAPARLR